MMNKKRFKLPRLLIALTLVLTLSMSNIAVFAEPDVYHDVTDIPVEENHIDVILENISSQYVESHDGWVLMDMAAYRSYNLDTSNITSHDARQAYIDYAISVVKDYTKAGEYATPDAEYAKAIITLQSLGVDPQNLFAAETDAPLNAVIKLINTDTTSIYSAAYVLPALMQGDYDTSSKENTLIEFILNEQDKASGAWGYEWDGFFHPDLDGTAMLIAALAPYHHSNDDVKQALSLALRWLMDQPRTGGVFHGWNDEPSANSTAMVIISLCSLGVDPKEEIDALLSLVNSELNGFMAGGETDSVATEQGFRALIAYSHLSRLKKNDNEAIFNIYDFSANALTPGIATEEGSSPGVSAPESDKKITVKFRMEGLGGEIWIKSHNVKIPSDAKVYHVFKKVLDAKGFTYTGADKGYVRSVTNPNGMVLSEYLHGPNSGWLYKVNGNLPAGGLLDQSLKDGDFILWYYTGDWKMDSSAGDYADEPFEDNQSKTEDKVPLALSFSDISKEDWFYNSVKLNFQKGIFTGISENTFSPHLSMTREMFATALWRLAEKPTSDINNGITYDDVPHGMWYSEAIDWVSKEGLMRGFGSETFRPTDAVTREQVAVVLARYIELKELAIKSTPVSKDIIPFKDSKEISSWAIPAVISLHEYGLLNGKAGNRFAPKDKATRAEISVLFQRLTPGQ